MNGAVILQHVAHEGPGRIVPVFGDFGIPIDLRRLDKGDQVPDSPGETRLLVIMGGPMGVSDIGHPQFPFLEQEVHLLKQFIEQDRPVLGICLGAQLLAHTAGAKVYPNVKPPAKPGDLPIPLPEIGWGPVHFPFPGGTEPIVMGTHDGAMMFHWHFDTFDLPRLPAPSPTTPPGPPPPTGNALLSSTRTCKNQAFRFRNRLFGFQYHVEMEQSGIEAMLTHGKADVLKVLGPDGEAMIRQDTEKHYARYAVLGERILRNFVQFLKLYS